MRLWSIRDSLAWGIHVRYERDVTPDTAAAWLAKFQADEPTIRFIVSARKPRVPR